MGDARFQSWRTLADFSGPIRLNFQFADHTPGNHQTISANRALWLSNDQVRVSPASASKVRLSREPLATLSFGRPASAGTA